MSHGAVPKQPVALLSPAEELAGRQQDAAHARAPAQPGGSFLVPQAGFYTRSVRAARALTPWEEGIRFVFMGERPRVCCVVSGLGVGWRWL